MAWPLLPVNCSVYTHVKETRILILGGCSQLSWSSPGPASAGMLLFCPLKKNYTCTHACMCTMQTWAYMHPHKNIQNISGLVPLNLKKKLILWGKMERFYLTVKLYWSRVSIVTIVWVRQKSRLERLPLFRLYPTLIGILIIWGQIKYCDMYNTLQQVPEKLKWKTYEIPQYSFHECQQPVSVSRFSGLWLDIQTNGIRISKVSVIRMNVEM